MQHLSDRCMVRFISCSLNTPLLQRAFIPARMVGAVTLNKSNNSDSFIHTLVMSFGKITLPNSSIVMVLLSIVLCHCCVSKRLVQFVTEHRKVVVYFLRGYLRIELGRNDVRMPQHTADTFNRHTFTQCEGGEPVPCTMEYTRQSKQQRTGID